MDVLTVLDGAFQEMEVAYRDGMFYFDVGNPWAGDTETGFGYTCHAGLSPEEARGLRDWLSSKLEAD